MIKTVAETGEGVPELCREILARFEASKVSGALEARRHASIKSQLKDLVNWQVMDYFSDQEGDGRLETLSREVLNREIDIYSAARELFSALIKGEKR